MNGKAISVHALVNCTTFASTMIDSGCLANAFVTPSLVKKAGLQCIDIEPRILKGVTGQGKITQVAKYNADIEGFKDSGWAYVANDGLGFDMIFGRPWMDRLQVSIASAKRCIYIHTTGQRIKIQSKEGEAVPTIRGHQPLRGISAAAYAHHLKAARAGKVQVFAASLADINKALEPKSTVDFRTKLPLQYQHHAKTFDPTVASQLPPVRGPVVDHKIELKEKDGKEMEPPWGPLYNMSRGELLVLRKELTSLLDKGWIRVSNSPAAAPILFVKKPGGGLRFCVDYRALNAITRKDRYPLPLIQETLNNLSKAKWFTKLDVSAAFHKIRINPGDEWKTAFRTRFGLYEWLVTPFGLANAPSTFQRYINWTLRKYIDDFCSAYLDDVLIYTDGSLKEHRKHVNKVLDALGQAGLSLDIKKCEFEVKSTKYLGFIIEAGQGLRMDPEKVKAIREWQAPKTVKGVRSFLGFANFYRQFIKDFSKLAAPLTRLTGNVSFRWTEEEQSAFEKLKDAFISDPVLAQFDPDRETVLETDASGYVVAGCLSQYDDQAVLRPVAYFSKKMDQHQVNYEIHDKELLAVVLCLKEWDAELRSVKSFKVITDHKNLEYFTKPRLLGERQMRWALLLGRYNMEIVYRPGKENVRADALCRREQDMPQDSTDERLQHRHMQLLRFSTRNEEPEDFENCKDTVITFSAAVTNDSIDLLNGGIDQTDLPPQRNPREYSAVADNLWATAADQDDQYQEARQAVLNGARRFPPDLQLKVSIAECSVDDSRYLLYRDRRWVPSYEPLRTGLIDGVHSPPVAGHPGRQITYQTVSRDYFWPGMSNDIRRFIRNCNVCGRTKPWRDGLQGLLKPLPVPDRIWKEISMDFITDLPESEGCTNMMVVTDRLSKDVVLVALPNLDVETVAWAFIKHVVAYHWLPKAIVSDRGSQFVSGLWKRLCEILGIQRRLSTAFHPQTDGSTERMNAVVEAYLRAYVQWDQKNWAKFLGMAMIAIRGRQASSTGVSPFFLQHGYHVDPVELHTPSQTQEYTLNEQDGKKRAEAIINKFKKVFELAQASMAEAQQEQERQANRHRKQPKQLRVGDKVWLSLGKHFRTRRTSKKLDWKNAKYTVTELIGTHNVRLNTPTGHHNVFHVDRLRLAADDPLPSQPNDDFQPEPLIIDGEPEYFVEKIMAEKVQKRGRGFHTQYEVKWEGYAETSWCPARNLDDNKALDEWEAYTAPFRNTKGRLPTNFRRTDGGNEAA
jgi:hypothetical protein